MRNYWWPEVTKDVGKYVERCDLCQRMKNRTEALAGNLMVNKVPVSYAKSTHSENTSLWWYSLSTSNLKSPPSTVVIFLAICLHGGNTTIWKFCLP